MRRMTDEETETWQAALAPDEPPPAREIAGAERERWQAALRPIPAIRPQVSDKDRQRWLEALADIGRD